MYIHIYIYIYIYMCISIPLSLSVYITGDHRHLRRLLLHCARHEERLYTYNIYIYIYLSFSLSLYIYIYIFLFVSLSLYMYMYVYIYTYTYIYIYIHKKERLPEEAGPPGAVGVPDELGPLREEEGGALPHLPLEHRDGHHGVLS